MNEDLRTEEVYALLDDAYAAGKRGYYLFGGEPLVRKDIGAIVDRAKRRGFFTCMNTNGSLLAAKAPSLMSLDVAFVSLDYYNGYHDEIRGHPGTSIKCGGASNRFETSREPRSSSFPRSAR